MRPLEAESNRILVSAEDKREGHEHASAAAEKIYGIIGGKQAPFQKTRRVEAFPRGKRRQLQNNYLQENRNG